MRYGTFGISSSSNFHDDLPLTTLKVARTDMECSRFDTLVFFIFSCYESSISSSHPNGEIWNHALIKKYCTVYYLIVRIALNLPNIHVSKIIWFMIQSFQVSVRKLTNYISNVILVTLKIVLVLGIIFWSSGKYEMLSNFIAEFKLGIGTSVAAVNDD